MNGTTPSQDQRGVARDFAPDCGSVEGFAQSLKNKNITALNSIRNIHTPLLTIYPNPAAHFISISFVSAKNNTGFFIINDMNGKTIYTSSQQIVVGKNNISFDVSKLIAGTYTVSLNAKNMKAESLKFVKQ